MDPLVQYSNLPVIGLHLDTLIPQFLPGLGMPLDIFQAESASSGHFRCVVALS